MSQTRGRRTAAREQVEAPHAAETSTTVSEPWSVMDWVMEMQWLIASACALCIPLMSFGPSAWAAGGFAALLTLLMMHPAMRIFHGLAGCAPMIAAFLSATCAIALHAITHKA